MEPPPLKKYTQAIQALRERKVCGAKPDDDMDRINKEQWTLWWHLSLVHRERVGEYLFYLLLSVFPKVTIGQVLCASTALKLAAYSRIALQLFLLPFGHPRSSE